jgi:hypothetical protein
LFSSYSQAKGPFLAALNDRALRWSAAKSGRRTPEADGLVRAGRSQRGAIG